MTHPPYPRWQVRPRLDRGCLGGLLFSSLCWGAAIAMIRWALRL